MELNISAWMPWIMAAVGIAIAWLVLSVVLKLARAVIGIGCAVLFIIAVIVIVVNYL